MDYYEALKDELFAKREQLRTHTRQSKIQGDYYEALIREFITRFIDDKLAVKHGLLYHNDGRRSRECDVIIYEKRKKPLFESGDLVIVNSEEVKFVMQIKSVLTSSTLKSAVNNLKVVKELNKRIMCWIVGFETELLLKTLYLKAWRSRSVQFLHVFESHLKRESESLLNSQMRFFQNAIRQCGDYSRYKFTNDLLIYRESGDVIALGLDKNEQQINDLLSKVHRDFWGLWESHEYRGYIYTIPRN